MNRRRFLKTAGGTALSWSLGVPRGLPRAYDFDWILKGGNVVDGTGREARRSDLGIRQGRIAAVGRLEEATARRSLDVSGLTVTPGFIDVHTHSEDELLTNPKAESKIRQGVTTELFGMDGSSIEPDALASELEKYEAFGAAVNVGTFVGQGTLRGLVMGPSDEPADPDDIRRMQALARTAFSSGAFGISSGLEYTPGGFASAEEIAELVKVMNGTPGLYVTHLRNEDDRVLEAVAEAVAIAEGAGVGLHVSHFKCQGRRNWNRVDEVFATMERAEARGVSVTMDRYPYTAYATGLYNLMPLWSREGGTANFIARLRDPDAWPRIREAMEEKISLLGGWDRVMVSETRLEKNSTLQGKTVAEIVERTGDDPFVFARDLIIEEKNRVDMIGFAMGEETTARILAHPKCMPASDGSSLADYGPLGRGKPHPRSYGTFARVLSKYVREMGVMPLEEAVRKMTSLPAERFGLRERGKLVEGFWADIAVFDPAMVRDRATFAEPHRYAEGFHAVLVNGRLTFSDGARTDALPGKVLRSEWTLDG